MKLSDYAKAKGVRYETAWRWFRDGQIKGRRFGRTIIVEEDVEVQVAISQKVTVYARVSSAENKSMLESPQQRISLCSSLLSRE
jgi:predicted site-specific integrase-resolvase